MAMTRAAVGILALGILTGAGQAPSDPVPRWIEFVHAHHPGDADAAVSAVGTWRDDVLEGIYREIDRVLGRIKADPARVLSQPQIRALGLRSVEDVNRLVKRGAVLHADIAMLEPPEAFGVPRLRPASSSSFAGWSVQARDGEMIATKGNAAHWKFGRMLLDGVLPDAAADPFVTIWYRATSAYQLHELLLNYADPHLAHSLARLPGDALLQLYAGSMHEHLSSPAVQNAVLAANLTLTNLRPNVGSERQELDRARQRLERAVEIDPLLVEARTRLGRVIDRLGEHDVAATHLRRALADATDDRARYFAALFLGRAEEHLRNFDAASDAFARAASLYPRAQSPRLAQSRIATELNHRAHARSALFEVFAAPPRGPDDDDPWWSYHIRLETEVEMRLADMYRATPEGTRR